MPNTDVAEFIKALVKLHIVSKYTDKVVKKLRFEALKELNSTKQTSAGRSFQGMHTRLKSVCLKILVLHLKNVVEEVLKCHNTSFEI